MSLLVLALPPSPAGPSVGYAWVRSVDGLAPTDHGEAAPALLPTAGRGVEVIARVPAAGLSWHRVELPRGIGPRSPRLRATLVGLLEERLLDEPEALHLALDAQAGNGGGPAWVAVCARRWLDGHLQALEHAGHPVARIVPELWPHAGPLQLTATGEPERAQLLASGTGVPGGAQALPLSPATLALLRPTGANDALQAQAEPAVAALAEQLLGQPTALISPAQRLLQASAAPWDLAQGELARTGAAWASRRAGAAWRDLLHAPRWRPARWGVAALLLAQLLGLNLWAWQTQRELDARRADVRAALTRAFPQVRVVVDAPVQMAREVAALRQGTGAIAPPDLEPLLAAYAHIARPDAAPTALEFSTGTLRLQGLAWPAETLAQAQTALRPLGYRLQTEGEATVLQPLPAP